MIEIDDVIGKVEGIQLFTTAITTLDNKRVIVPNSSLTEGNIINYTVTGKLRVDTVIGVAYDADIDRVKKVISEAIQGEELQFLFLKEMYIYFKISKNVTKARSI